MSRHRRERGGLLTGIVGFVVALALGASAFVVLERVPVLAPQFQALLSHDAESGEVVELPDVQGFLETMPAPMADVTRGLSYELLSSDQQSLYNQIAAAIDARQQTVSLGFASVEDVDAAFTALSYDHPEYFWLEGYEYVVYPARIDLSPRTNCAYDEIDGIQAAIEERVQQVLATIPADTSTYQRVRAIYTWIIENTDYSLEASNNQNVRSVFLGGSSVCGGYARAFQLLCHRLGIPCAYVTGTLAGGGTHAWNLVTIDGVQTYVDVTWGDPTYADGSSSRTNYDYLCLTTDEISRDHFAGDPAADALPYCADASYDGCVLAGTYMDIFDSAVMQERISAAVAEGRGTVTFKFANDTGFGAALDYIASSGIFIGDLGWVGAFTYTGNDTLRTVTLWW